MSAEILREAATLMRERAQASADGKTWFTPGWLRDETQDVIDRPDAEHIASWHPAVALAVADWLDATALGLDVRGVTARPKSHEMAAFAVARAYLGRDA